MKALWELLSNKHFFFSPVKIRPSGQATEKRLDLGAAGLMVSCGPVFFPDDLTQSLSSLLQLRASEVRKEEEETVTGPGWSIA